LKVLVVDGAKFMRLTLGKEYKPDLVTMGITMPEMDGVEAVKRLK